MFGNPSYPTYQAFLGLGIAAAIALLLMPWWIKLLKVEGIGQQVRADGPKRHLVKQGTPTMGGVVILVAISLTCLLMGKLTTELVLVLLATLATGVLGLIDDLTSVTHGRSLGLTPHAKMIGLTIICVTFTVLAVNWCGVAPEIRFPGGLTIDLGVLSTTICGYSFPWLYIVFCWLMIAGLSNAVNLTDGLDGLAGGTSMIAMLAMAAMAFLHGDVNLSIFCTACAGACLGFLWFNCYPASIFMGDTGSLALGAAFACTSIMTNTEVVSLIIGGLFIVETLSVMIQVVYFHFTHKRVFLMAPIHHHFEKKGWAETKVVIRFWIIAAAFGAVGLALFFQLGQWSFMPLADVFSLLVLGQGKSGLDVARWALAHPERVSAVTVYGGGTSEPNDATRALEAAGASFVYGTEQVEGAYDVCVTCPGISEFSGFFKAGREHAAQIMGEPEFAYRLSPDNWIAITGTNGKTTTTSLTDYLLKAAGEASVAVANIGEPPVNEIDGRAHNEWFVAELSSYQIATTNELHPRVAVLLNITPDHLGWHKSHKNYALAKIKLFDNMVDDDLVVVDVEDAGIHEFDEYIYTPGRRICKVAFDEPEGADAAFVRDGKMVVRLKGVETQLVATSELKISGHHNVINALCAATAALAVGADVDGVRRGLASFQPLEHRVEPCGEIDGVRYVNDSKATNTDAVEKALTAFPDDDVILLLGGHDKGTPLTDFARVVMDNVRSVVCFGDARERFTAAMDEADVDGDVDIAQADDLRDAVDVARSLSSRGDVILLSPACSSFDEFSGYEERGRVFKDYVAQLAAAAKSQME